MARTIKDYEQRLIQLEALNNKKNIPNVEIGEVWRYYIGLNVGNEISKGYNEQKGLKGSFKRMGIILNELKNRLVLVAPITTKQSWFSSLYGIKLKNYGCDAWVLPDQIHLVDRKRFDNKVYYKDKDKKIKYSSNFTKKLITTYKDIISIKKIYPY